MSYPSPEETYFLVFCHSPVGVLLGFFKTKVDLSLESSVSAVGEVELYLGFFLSPGSLGSFSVFPLRAEVAEAISWKVSLCTG